MLKQRVQFKKPFIVVPDAICFSNYEDNQTHVKKITIKNNDYHIQQVNVRFDTTDELRLNVFGDQRLVPGLDIVLEIVFCPNRSFFYQKRDRKHEIQLLSHLKGKQKYRCLIPITLLSPNPSLTLPKEIFLPKTCPGVATYSTTYICNYGPLIQEFTLTYPKEITIEPFKKRYSISSGKHETLLITSKPNDVGDLTYEITFNFDSNKQISIPIKSVSIECQPIYFRDAHIDLPDTYLGHTSMKSTQIMNDSEFKVKYQFCAFRSEPEDVLFKDKVGESYGRYLHYNYDRVNDFEYTGAISRNVHRCILDRQLLSYRHAASRLIIPFESKYFEIIPAEGEIFPKSFVTINVVFHPPSEIPQSESGSSTLIEKCAYLQCNGNVIARSELKLSGVVLGPKIDFETKEFRLKPMHCGETVHFDLSCKNYGVLDGEIAFEAFESRFGGEVSVDPSTHTLKPNETAVFHIKYTNFHVGQFVDLLRFSIASGDSLHVKIIGNVKPLIVHITPGVADFGQVPICCQQFQYLHVKNILTCPISIKFEFEKDDEDVLLCFDEFEAKTPTKPLLTRTEDSQMLQNTVLSATSLVSNTDECFNNGLLTDGFESVRRLLFEYEKLDEQIFSQESLNSSVEAVNDIFNQILYKTDQFIELEDYKQHLQSIIYQMIDNWIENKQLIEILLDETLDELLDTFHANSCINDRPFIPFFEKCWNLNENAKEYYLTTSDMILLQPNEMRIICLNLVPNWPGIFRSRLKVYVSWNESSCDPCCNKLSIPLLHNCVIPDIVLDHTDIIELEMFVGQSSSNIIRVKNLNEAIDGFIYAFEYETDEFSIRSTPVKEIVPKGMEQNIKITITCYILGDIEHTYQLFTLGNDKPIPVTFKIKSKSVQIKVDPTMIVTENLSIGDVAVTNFLLRNLSPVQIEYDIKINSNTCGSYSIESYDHYLVPYDMVEISVKQSFDTPGLYDAVCLIDVLDGYGSPEKVKLQTRVTGVPLQIHPDIKNDLLDLGIMIFDKRPFHSIEFTVTNTGRIKYYIVAKLQYEEDFNVDDSRIEIHPGESRILRVHLCPKFAKKINDVLFLNASSSGMRKDFEMFKMVNIKGTVVKPQICFSRSNVTLEIKYGEDYDKVGYALIYLENHSLIHFNVNCTINGDYELIDTENCRIDTCLDMEISPKEKKEIAIHFNTDLVGNGNVSRIFTAKLKAFVEGKLQAVTDVTTVVKYPSINIEKSLLYINQAQIQCFTTFSIQNSQEIDAVYTWELVEDSFSFDCLPKRMNNRAKSVIDEIMSRCDHNIMNDFVEELRNCCHDSAIEITEAPSENEGIIEIEKLKEKKKRKKVSIQTESIKDPNNDSPKKKKSLNKRKSSATSIQSEALSTATNVSKKSKKGKRKTLSTTKETIKESQPDWSSIEITDAELENALTDFWSELTSPLKDENFFPESNETQTRLLTNLVEVFPTSGTLRAKSCQTVSLQIKENVQPCKYSFILRLNITNGCSRNIEVQVVNDHVHLELNKSCIDFETQPWYSIKSNSFEISTTSYIPICVQYFTTKEADEDLLLHGKLLLNETRVQLSNKYSQHITKLMCFMGLNSRFDRIIGVECNNRAPIPLRITGDVQIPNVTFVGCELIKMNEMPSNEIEFHYRALRGMYEMWNGNDKKNERQILNQVELLAPSNSKVSVQLSEVLMPQDSFLLRLTKNLIVTKENKVNEDEYLDEHELIEMDFIVLWIHPGVNVPHFWEVKNFIEHNSLVYRVNECQEVESYMNGLTKTFVMPKLNKAHMSVPKRYVLTGKPTSFTIEPITDWCMPVQSYVLDMGDIKLNESKKCCFEFVYHGPGLFNACIRADLPLPGVSIKFIAPEEACFDEIPLKFTLKDYLPDIKLGQTFERSSVNPCKEVTHAHSFDFTDRLVHVRKIIDTEEKTKIKEHYNKLNKPKARDPNTYAEIFQETSKDATGQTFGILIEFQPKSTTYGKKFYQFREKLHLDLHLGPSIPLILHANIVPGTVDDCSCMKKLKK